MRVLYVSKALHVAAYRSKLHELARHVEVRALVPRRWGTHAPEPGDQGLVTLWPALLHGHNHLHLYRRAGRPLDDFAPDLVHIDEEPYSAATAQYVRLCSQRRLPCLFFAWQNLPKRLPAPFGAVRRYVFGHVAGAIAGTDAAADVLRAAGFTKPLAVIPQFGVDPERFAPDPRARADLRDALGAGAEDCIVGFGGRLVPEKGVLQLLEAVSALDRVRLVFIGDGPARKVLEARAAAPDLTGRVHFTGHTASCDMPRRLAGLDLLVLPSLTTTRWKEQFGRILVEAMACGVPVIGSDSGEIPNVIGAAGEVVPQADAGALRTAIATLRDDPTRRETLGAAGRDRVVTRFSGERVARETVQFYREVLACPN